tara:strand:+ start:3375 stop:5666 length:2292 start_codon:yes stop_codon:yes gene_type:complete
MIDTTKLLPRLKESTLSKESMKNLVEIKKDVVKLDNLLKERLVLSKVREGILRQQEENQRRLERESSLEGRNRKDKDSDYKVDLNSKKPKPGSGGLVGAIITSVLRNFSAIAFAKIGSLLKVGKLLKVLLAPKALVIVGTLTLLSKVLTSSSKIGDNVKEKDLNAIKGDKVSKAFENFNSSLQIFAGALIGAGIASLTGRFVRGRKLRKQEISALRGRLTAMGNRQRDARAKADAEADMRRDRARRGEKITRGDIVEVDRKGRVIKKEQVEINKQKIKVAAGEVGAESEVIGKTIEPRKSVSGRKFIPATPQPTELFEPDVIQKADSFARKKGKIRVQPDEVIPIGRRVRDRVKGTTELRDDLFIRNPTGSGSSGVKVERITFSSKDGREFDQFFIDDDVLGSKAISDLRKNKLTGNFKVLGEEFGTDFKNLSPKGQLELGDLLREENQTPLGKVLKQESKRRREAQLSSNIRAKRFKQTFGKPTGADPFTGRGTFGFPSVTSFDPKTGTVTQKLTGRREFDPETGGIKLKRRKISADAITGAAEKTPLKALRGIIRKKVDLIPFIGDFVGLLLDIFVFGEPPGRAAFMAVGGAVGGFLGGMLGSIGGPPGAIILGILGGIGGDILGGLSYDLLFRRDSKNPLDRIPKATIKQGIKQGLFSGGFASLGNYILGEQGKEFVLDADTTAALEDNYPGFLSALNKADYDGALEVLQGQAFYEMGTGTEQLIPIPIPSPSPSDPDRRVNTITIKKSSSNVYFQHYRR